MEMEPVSRHLGEYILSTGNESAYSLFVSTFLHLNVISDFRNRKTYRYYDEKHEKSVNGLKILPFATAELRTVLKNNISYERLYSLFEMAFHSSESELTWYEREVMNNIHS